MASPGGTYRAALGTVLRGTASAYGYALTLTTSTQALTAAHGTPRALDLWLFLVGGVAAFAVLEAGLLALPGRAHGNVEHAFPLAGVLNLVAVSAGYGIATLVAHGLDGPVAWPLAAFAATAVYLTLAAAQAAVIGTRVSSGG